jgi:hypothetical protein
MQQDTMIPRTEVAKGVWLGRGARPDHRIALNSGHNIQLTEPQLIVDAVARFTHADAR